MNREKNLQDKVIKYLKSKNIYHLNLFGDGFSGKGKPDIICCVKGKFIALELKVGLNDMQDDQKIHKKRIENNGGLHYVPRNLEEVKEIIESI